MSGHWLEDETPPVTVPDVRVPVMWDGIRLEWYGWMPPVTGFLCANNDLTRFTPCPGCGRQWLPFVNRAFEQGWERRHHSRLRVILERCGYCGFTVATSRHEDGELQEWVLDETDYGPEGSVV